MYGRRPIFALPPYVTVVGESHVGINCVVRDRSHRVWIRFIARPGHHTEIAVLRIDGVQTAIANSHPADVVSNRGHLPAFEMRGWNEHCEIRLAACAWECSSDIVFAPFGRFHAKNQRVLRHPALCSRQVGTYAQGEAFFAQ